MIVRLCFLSLFVASVAYSQETTQINVESTRLDENQIEPSRYSFVIEEAEIQRKNATSVQDILRDIPGLEVDRQGGPGQTTSVFIRGARSEDTLVLIDGIEANEAMSPSCGYDFSTLSPENISKIEVYEGPQSVRFGAGALGGVINIVTKKGSGPVQFGALAEGGSYQTMHGRLNSEGSTGQLNYSASIEELKTAGFSAAAEQDGNTENDGATLKFGSTKFSWDFDKSTSVEATLRYTTANVDIDAGGGIGGDDPNNTTTSKQLISGVTGITRSLGGRLRTTLGAYYSEVTRTGTDLEDATHPYSSAYSFLSETRKVESNNEFTLDDHQMLRLGLQLRQETGIDSSTYSGTVAFDDRHSQSVGGVGLTYLFDNEALFFDVGGRVDSGSVVSRIYSDRASIGYRILPTGSQLSITYGTGFKLPSLYQLYSTYGSTSLAEERSTSVEASIEQKLGDQTKLKVTYFDNTYSDMIDYDTSTSRYFNVSKAKSQGAQVLLSAQISDPLSISAGYTYLDARDESTGAQLVRRPRNALTAELAYHIPAFEISAQYHYRGSRDDVDPTSFLTTTNRAYDVVNLEGRVPLTQTIRAVARVDNVFNRQYEEVLGYGTARLSFYGGLEGQF